MRQVKKARERQHGGDGSTAGIGNVQTILRRAGGTISRAAAGLVRGSPKALFYLFLVDLLLAINELANKKLLVV